MRKWYNLRRDIKSLIGGIEFDKKTKKEFH